MDRIGGVWALYTSIQFLKFKNKGWFPGKLPIAHRKFGDELINFFASSEPHYLDIINKRAHDRPVESLQGIKDTVLGIDVLESWLFEGKVEKVFVPESRRLFETVQRLQLFAVVSFGVLILNVDELTD